MAERARVIQYTVTNIRGGFAPGQGVVIRTFDRMTARRFGGPGYRITCRDRGRDYYGLRTLERRAAATVQYGLPGIGRDLYLGGIATWH